MSGAQEEDEAGGNHAVRSSLKNPSLLIVSTGLLQFGAARFDV